MIIILYKKCTIIQSMEDSNLNNKNFIIKSTDTIHHVAQVIKAIRNNTLNNIYEMEIDPENTLKVEYMAALEISVEKEYAIHMKAIDGNTLLVEVATNYTDPFKLSKRKTLVLEKDNWFEIPKWSCYRKTYDISDENLAYSTAAELILTMIKIYDYKTYEPIAVSLYEKPRIYPDKHENKIITKARKTLRKMLLVIVDFLDR